MKNMMETKNLKENAKENTIENLIAFVSVFAVPFALGIVGCNGSPAKLSSAIAPGGIVLSANMVSAKSGDAIPANFVNNKETRVTVNDSTIKFHTSIFLKNDVYNKKTPGNNPLVRVSVVNGSGAEVEMQQREGAEIDWQAHLLGADGDYDVRAALVNGDKIDDRFESQIFRFRLDTAAPVIVSLSQLKANSDHTGRTFSLNVKATDLSKVSCTSVVSSGVTLDASLQAIPIDLKAGAGDSANPNLQIFASDSVAISDDYPNVLLVKTTCLDIFNNKSEITETASFEQPQFNINASIAARQMLPYEDKNVAGAPQRYMLRTGTGAGGASTAVNLSLKLMDKVSGVEAVPTVVAREKGKLQVYLSSFEFSDIKDADVQNDPVKKLFLRKIFDTSFEASIPSSMLGKQTIYLSLTQIRESDGKEMLVGSQPLQVYVEQNGEQLVYEWGMDHQFVPAIQNATITAVVKITPHNLQGAPLVVWPSVEYSVDNATWVRLPAASVNNWHGVPGQDDTYAFEIKYPLAQESDFRIRVAGESASGNTSASKPSKNLLAPAGFSMNSSACNGNGLFVAKGSSFLCKRIVSNEIRYFAFMVMKNTGNALFNVAQKWDCYSPTQKCVKLTGVLGVSSISENLDASPFTAPDFVSQKQMTYLYGSLKAGDIANSDIFQATFNLNGPSCSASPQPLVQLKGSGGINLAESAFDCD